MLLRVFKVYKVRIREVRRIPTKKDPGIVITHLHVDMFNEQAEQLAVTPYQISPTMDVKPLYDFFNVPADLPLEAFVGYEGYAEVLEMLQLNNTVTRNIKRFISEQEYQKLSHLNEQPSPTPVSEEELAVFKKQTLTKIEEMKAVKEKRKQGEANKPKATAKAKKKVSQKAVKAFSMLMQDKAKRKKKQLPFKGNLVDGFSEKAYPAAFERNLVSHNKGYTKPGAIGSYTIIQAKKECEYKNGVSIKNFRQNAFNIDK
jgi:hypothetical protein